MQEGEATVELPSVTLSASGMPLVEFARQLSDLAGISLVVEEELDVRPVSVEVRDVPVDRLLGLVARRLGVEVSGTGRTWYVGKLRPEDRGVLVRRVGRLEAAQLQSVVETLLSTNGEVQAFSDGLVVVADRVDVLQRVEDLLARVESSPAGSWVVQLHLVGVRESDLRSFGLDAVPSLEVAATFAEASVRAPDSAWSASGGLAAVLVAARESEAVEVMAAPLFVVREGSGARMEDGDELRLPTKTVSDQGTVTVTGFEVVQTGLQVEVAVREVAAGQAILTVGTSLSAVVSVGSEGEPTINRQAFSTEAVVQSGGVYLLGALERVETREAVLGPFALREDRTSVARQILLWGRVLKVGGPVG